MCKLLIVYGICLANNFVFHLLAGLHCCELRPNETCRKVCQETLQSAESQDEMIDRVIAACGMADPLVSVMVFSQIPKLK